MIAYESEWNTFRAEASQTGIPATRCGVAAAIRITADACRGVEHLHVRGIVHRGIQPGSLLPEPTDNVEVSDLVQTCVRTSSSVGVVASEDQRGRLGGRPVSRLFPGPSPPQCAERARW